jgi:hypothetical protein
MQSIPISHTTPELTGANFTSIGKDGKPRHYFPKGYKVKTLKEFVMEAINPHDPDAVRKSNELRNINVNMNNPLYRAKNAISGGYNSLRNAVTPTTNVIPNNANATPGTNNIIAGRNNDNNNIGKNADYYSPFNVAIRSRTANIAQNVRINTAFAPNSYNQGGNTNNLLNGDNLQRQTNQSNLRREQDNAKAVRSAQRSEYYQNAMKPAIKRTAANIAKKAMSRNYWRKDIKPALNTIANAFRR